MRACVVVFCLQSRTCWSTWTPSSPITSPSPTPWSWSSFWLVRSRKCRELMNQSNRSMHWSILKIHFLCFVPRGGVPAVPGCSAGAGQQPAAATGQRLHQRWLLQPHFSVFWFLFLFYTDLLCQRLCVPGARNHVSLQRISLCRLFF